MIAHGAISHVSPFVSLNEILLRLMNIVGQKNRKCC